VLRRPVASAEAGDRPAGGFPWEALLEGLRSTRSRLRGHDPVLIAAGLTFYAVIAVVPLLVVALAVAGLVLGTDRLVGAMRELAALAPAHLGFDEQLVALAVAAEDLGALTIAAALVPATTYGEGLLRAFDRIAERSTRRKGLRGRVRALALLGVLPLLVLGALLAVAVLPGMLGMGLPSLLLGLYLTFLLAWAGGTFLLAVTYRAFSPLPLTARATLWAAAGTGSFLAGMSLGWVAVLEFGVDVGEAYGGAEAIGALVLFAIYLFLVQGVCLTGYAWALELDERFSRPRPAV
jgi:membrane protein